MLLDDESQDDKSVSNDSIGTDLDEFFFSGHSIRFEVGGNFAFDSDIKGDPSSGNSFAAGTIKFDTGVDFLFTWGIPLSEELSLELSTGFAYADISGITSAGAAATTASINANAISFRYQIGATVDWDFTSDFGIGAYVRYAGTTENDFGAPDFTGPNPSTTSQFRLNDLSSVAVGLTAYINF